MADQMIQAARSGKQNIAEGSSMMHTSLKMCIKLTNVAHASLEELTQDYEDFLRQRRMAVWDKDDIRVKRWRSYFAKLVRNLSDLSNLGGQLKLPSEPEVAANLLLTLSHQASYLLYRQVQSLERKHEREGGYTEKLYNRRVIYRKNLK